MYLDIDCVESDLNLCRSWAILSPPGFKSRYSAAEARGSQQVSEKFPVRKNIFSWNENYMQTKTEGMAIEASPMKGISWCLVSE